jgi:serine/threonine protein kinase
MKATRFGRYLLLDKVASGGMAEVWRARITGESGFQRIIAIKKILPHVSEDADFISMFTDEANITVQLQHPNIGQVYEFSKNGDIYYIAMEYISGKDLKTVWSHMRQRKTVIPHELSCFCIQKMAEGLSSAHNKRDNFGSTLGIVHRDVSPQNCILSWEGEVKVIDFGIAKAEDKTSRTRAGTLKGKFAYMAPEQIRGLKLDGRADTFALGVCLYELLTGERGFQAENEFSLLEKVRNVEIKPPTMVNRDIPPELERIVFKAIAKDRDDRYPDAADLAEDLQRYMLGRGKPPKPGDLGEFLRQSFTVDYDKERLRLESYREIEVEEEQKPLNLAEVALPAFNPTSLQEPFDPVRAAMADERSGTFAAGEGAFADAHSQSGARLGRHNTQTGSYAGQSTNPGESRSYVLNRPGADPTGNTSVTPVGRNIAPPMQKQPAKKAGNSMVLKVAFALLLVGALGGVGAFVATNLLQGKGTIVVTVSGAAQDAEVLIDGKLHLERASPSVAINGVSAGEHLLIVQKAGFKTYTGQIVVQPNKAATINATLKRVGDRVRVVSEPVGASVFLNGNVTGEKTPTNLEDVEGGTVHRIVVRLEGYKEVAQEIEVEPGQNKTLHFLLRPEKVKVKILSTPPGAVAFLDGVEVGKTPLTFEQDPDASPTQLTLERPGCKSYTSSIVVEGNKPEEQVSLTLKCR